MILTREQLPRLSEDTVRKHVLIRLFRAMGFRDVTDYHGTTEHGKDVVMWKPAETRDRVNYAVVLKKKVNGRATGAGSAGEVITQITECFGTPFKDPITGEDRTINQCFVIIYGTETIPKEFTNAVAGPLTQNSLGRHTDFIDSEKLWTWIRKHIPEATIFGSMQQLQTLITDQFPGFGANIQLSEKALQFGLTAIDPQAVTPQTITFHISLEGKTGEEMRAQYNKFIKTGEGFTIAKEMLKGIEMPDVLKKLLNFSDDKLFSFSFTPTPSPAVKWHFKRSCENGYKAELRDVELRTIQAGTEQATLNNDHQDVPWKLKIVANRDPNGFAMNLSYAVKLAECNAKQALDWFRFHYAISQPGVLTMEHAETGIEWPTSNDLGRAKPPDELLLIVAEKLAYIQTRTKTRITFPLSITPADLQRIEELYAIVKTGRVPLTSFTGSFESAPIISNYEGLKHGGAFNFESTDSPVRECCGSQFDIGLPRIVASSAVPDAATLARIENEMKKDEGHRAERIEVTLVPSGDASMEVVFPKWLSE